MNKHLTKTTNIWFLIQDFFRLHRIKFMIAFIICLIGVLTGIITAVKYIDNFYYAFYDFGIFCTRIHGSIFTFGIFFVGIYSFIGILLILTICSLTKFLHPIAYVILAYRAYLIGLNISLLIAIFGVGGALAGLFVILPCQLIIYSLMTSFFIHSSFKFRVKKEFGGRCNEINGFVLFLVYAGLILLTLIVQMLLLLIFNCSFTVMF